MKQIVTWLIVIALSLGIVQAEEGLNDGKPFADTHIIMQVSDADPVHYQAVLDISNNLTKGYGQEMIDIEIIAFGAGVPMLLAKDNKFSKRIASLQEHGVRFYVCGNTLDTMERKSHKRPEMVLGVQVM